MTGMSDRDRSVRAEIERRLLSLGAKIPTSSWGRLRRTVAAGLKGGRMAWRHGSGNGRPVDLDALTALVSSIGQLKGIAMKAGQFLGYLDLPLSEEMQAAFASLQTHSPPMPFADVARVIRAELGERATSLLAGTEQLPVAAASIGQVHRARLDSGRLEVAVKVQYPGIEQALVADFRSAAVGKTFAGLFAPGADIETVLTEIRSALLEECDYEREAGFQQRFAAIYAGHPVIAVPTVHRAYTSRRVITTTWAEGLRFDDLLASDPPQANRDRVGVALFEFYVGTLFRHGLYNWDPHPGNYVFRRDGGLSMLDYGSTREFSLSFVRKLATLSLAVHADERDALHVALVDLGMVREGKPYDFEAIRALLRSFFGPMLKDEVVAIERGQALPLRQVLDSKRKLLEFQFPGELLFTFRIRFGLLSVLARLGARANWYRLERAFAEEALARTA